MVALVQDLHVLGICNGSCAYGDSLGSVRKWDFIAESSPFSSHLFLGGWVWGTTMSGYTFFSHSYYLKC